MKGLTLVACAFLSALTAVGCKTRSAESEVKDLEFAPGARAADGTGKGVIQWPCTSRRYGVAADRSLSRQDEYCEWRYTTVASEPTARYCQFTVSMWNNDELFLHHPNNTLGAADSLVADCIADAQTRIAAGQPLDVGCEGARCEGKRNSDPHICDEVRLLVKNSATYSHRVIDLDPNPIEATVDGRTLGFSPMPLMKMAPLDGKLPAGCAYGKTRDGKDDQKSVFCRLGTGQKCTNFGSEINVGMQIELLKAAPKASASAAASPESSSTSGEPPVSLGLNDDTDGGSGKVEPLYDTTGSVPVPQIEHTSETRQPDGTKVRDEVLDIVLDPLRATVLPPAGL